MYSSGVCISPPCAQPRQSAGMPAASAALASVDAATSSSGSAELLAHAAHGREQRLTAVEPPGRAPPEHLDLERERRLDREQVQRAREARQHRLVERALLDHELGVRRDRVDRRAALDAADVRARLAPRRTAERARDAARPRRSRSGGRDSPRSGRPGRARRCARAGCPTASTATCRRPWPSSASACSGRSSAQAARAPARLPSPSSPTVNATASPARSRSCASCSTTWRAHTTAAALSPTPGPRRRAPSRCGSCGTSRAKTVSTCASSEHARSALAEAPDQVARRVDVPPARRAVEPPLEPRDPLALVERRRRHACEREQVVEGIVHGAHAAGTLSGSDAPGLIAAGARPEGGSGLDRGVHAEAEVARLRDQHHVLDRVGVVQPLLGAERARSTRARSRDRAASS